MDYAVISFYRYTQIEDPNALVEGLTKQCNQLNILGRILIGTEGINGAVSGKKESTEKFKQILQERFEGLTFREQDSETIAYHKLVCKVREEICAFGADVDLNNGGVHLKPAELKEWYENNEEFIIVDARNDYEFDVGHFKDAIKLPIQTFREFPNVAPRVLENDKDKKIVLYCTGGIRCEKASAYLKEQGFENVYQVDGGIINYANQVGDNKWEGGLFVFDDRLISELGEPITTCTHCHNNEEKMYNCHNLECDKLFVSCDDCAQEMNKTCCKDCKESPHQRPAQQIAKQIIGKVENYYPKAHVALMKVEKPITRDITLFIKGKTTDTQITVHEIRDVDGNPLDSASNQLITVPITEKVRKNDLVMISF